MILNILQKQSLTHEFNENIRIYSTNFDEYKESFIWKTKIFSQET